MRYVSDNLVYLNAKQAEFFLGDNEPRDVEFFDGQPASAYWAEMHEGLYIVLHSEQD